MNRKDKLTNLLKLDELLGNGEEMTLEEMLIELPDVDKRTFYNYKDELKVHYGAPIECRRRGRFSLYRYTDPGFSIKEQVNQEMNIHIISIQQALDHLSLMDGDSVNNAIIRLYLLGLKNDLLNDHRPFMAFDNNIYSTGINFIDAIGEAIINKTPLKIEYKPFYKDCVQPTIHPYFLKQFNNRWYLLAWNEKAKKIYNYALDRIVAIEQANDTKYLPTNVDFTEFFDDIVGVTNYDDKQVETIRLRINKSRRDYIETKPLHPSQIIEKGCQTNDESIFINISVKVNTELKMLLLSYGDSIEVIEPISLRETMKEITLRMTALYDK